MRYNEAKRRKGREEKRSERGDRWQEQDRKEVAREEHQRQGMRKAIRKV